MASGFPATGPIHVPLLEVRGLTLVSAGGEMIVDGVDLAVEAGEIVALVGESGSGKSLTALAILGLLPQGVFRVAGKILLDGVDVTGLDGVHAAIRGRRIVSIFQDPQASLDPRWTIGRYLAGQLARLRGLTGANARRAAADMLRHVGLGDPGRILKAFPHELSGGMAQRVMIAGALAGEPQLLIADEPTTALDVTTQAQILDLLDDVQAETGLGILMITHDLGVVAEVARRTIVLYGGRVMEAGATEELLNAPIHPYTQALLASMPDIDLDIPPQPIGGHPGDRPDGGGCPFQPRCGLALAGCESLVPPTTEMKGRRYACHLRAGAVFGGSLTLAAR